MCKVKGYSFLLSAFVTSFYDKDTMKLNINFVYPALNLSGVLKDASSINLSRSPIASNSSSVVLTFPPRRSLTETETESSLPYNRGSKHYRTRWTLKHWKSWNNTIMKIFLPLKSHCIVNKPTVIRRSCEQTWWLLHVFVNQEKKLQGPPSSTAGSPINWTVTIPFKQSWFILLILARVSSQATSSYF